MAAMAGHYAHYDVVAYGSIVIQNHTSIDCASFAGGLRPFFFSLSMGLLFFAPARLRSSYLRAD